MVSLFFGSNLLPQGKRILIPIERERSTTAHISFQPTETCA
jgi:hypothetical protein